MAHHLGTWTTMNDVEKIKPLDPFTHTPFVAEALKNLRHEVGNKATVLGFVGCPYTLATYMVEGKLASVSLSLFHTTLVALLLL